MSEQKIQIWYCYILNYADSESTYNGSTNDLTRRLRQHNSEISGGAIATKRGQPHEYICVISGFSTHKIALSCEWWIRHPTGARKRPSQFSKPCGRIKGLNYLFSSDIWKEKFGNETLLCNIKDEYKKYLTDTPQNVTIGKL